MGFLITFEGIEGCGKTTQAELLKGHLKKKGRDVLGVREPGGTGLGEKIRALLLNGEEGMSPWAELFLYEASRIQLVSSVIKPALDGGKTVLCDRFIDSTTAYQGYGRGLDLEAISFMNRLGSLGLAPALTIVVDCPTEVGLKRAWSRIEARRESGGVGKEDRFEKEALDFHRRVRDGYLKIAREEPERVRVVEGTRDIHAVHREICVMVENLFTQSEEPFL